MKIAPRDISRFLKNPPADVRAILCYGPDGGLVRERAGFLARQVVEDLDDPFRVMTLSAGDLKSDPARLADEAAAISMTGGRRVVRVREDGDTLPPGPFETLLESPGTDTLVVVEAGDLAPRSPLRKLFESAEAGAAVPCYADEGTALEDVIQDTLRRGGLSVSPDALAFLASQLGGDRRVIRGELEKLILFKKGDGEVSLEDAQVCVGDSAALSLDSAILAAADGDHQALDRAVARLYEEGVAPVGVIRGALRHFQRLHYAAGLMATGKDADQAMGALRPPVFFKVRDRMRRQLRLWNRARAAQALDLLNDAESACKQTGMPDRAIAARALFSLANAARRARGS